MPDELPSSSNRSMRRPVTWLHALTGFHRPAPAQVARLDALARFLYAARSLILVITVQAVLLAGLLAAAAHAFALLPFLGVLVGLTCAHLLSNLSNDYVGFTRGHDTPDSPRLRYTIHPLAHGVLSVRALIVGSALLAALAALIMVLFIVRAGGSALVYSAAGLLLGWAYDAAPVPLKQLGLGELAVGVVWGPLMVGGGFAMITRQSPEPAMLVSLPFACGVMSILLGKHLDQRTYDSAHAIRTLPVRIGERPARALTGALIVAMYALSALLVVTRWLPRASALVLLALPRALGALRALASPAPAAAPPGYVGWPLWYHRHCLVHNRLFGWLYVAALALALVPGLEH